MHLTFPHYEPDYSGASGASLTILRLDFVEIPTPALKPSPNYRFPSNFKASELSPAWNVDY
jgi:hypothetical protein